MSAVLQSLANNADLVVREAVSSRIVAELEAAATRAGRAKLARIMRDTKDCHAAPETAAALAQRSGAKALTLTHIAPLIPHPFFDDMFLKDARARFLGPVWVMRHRDMISLPRAGRI